MREHRDKIPSSGPIKKESVRKGCTLKDSTTKHENTHSFLKNVGVFYTLFIYQSSYAIM